MHVAQTNIQLYNQLRDQGLPQDEMALVHRAYDLLTTLYSGHYQANGKPFEAHSVGVASIVAALDQPGDIVAAALIHNIYGNGDFGDGLRYTVTPSRRRLVREAVGEPVEELVARFQELRIRPHTIDRIRAQLPALDLAGRRLLVIDIADHVEKYVDHGVLYLGDGDWVHERTEKLGRDLAEIAEAVGEPRLAEMLSAAVAETGARAAEVSADLRGSDRRQYMALVVPRSCRRRLAPRIRARLSRLRRRARHRLRPVTARLSRPARPATGDRPR